MISSTTTTIYALLLSSISVGAAGAHNRFGVGAHRRHHARAAAATTTSVERSTSVEQITREKREDECTLGAWKCVGSVLQRCYNDQWNFVTNCTGTDIICSDGLYTTGCVWTWSVEQNDDANESATSSPPFTSSITVTPTSSASDSLSTSADVPSVSITNVNLAVEPTATATPETDEECDEDDEDQDEDDDDEYCDDDDDGAWEEYMSSATSVPSTTATSATSLSTAAASSPTSAIGGELIAGGDEDDDTEGDEEECDEDDEESVETDSASPATTASATATSIIGGQLWAGEGNSAPTSTHDWYSWDSASTTSQDWDTWDQATAAPTSTNQDWNNWDQATSTASSSRGHGKGKGHKSSSADWAASTSSSWDQSADVGGSSDKWSTATTTNSWDDWSGQATASSAAWGQSGKVSATASASASVSSKSGTSSNHTSSSPSGSYSSAPHYVIYADNWLTEMPSVDVLSNFNRFILAFWMTDSGAVDNAQFWEQLDSDTRQQVLTEYHNAGIALMVSAFGSTDSPTSNGADPAQTAQKLAKWVKDYGLDGVDIDYEDMSAMNSAKAVAWLVTFQKELRSLLPSPYIITHAPVAPWFTSANDYSDKAYVAIHEQTGDGIDFYNIQFYNQGSGVYEDCDSLLFNSGNDWPSTSVFEINSSAGLPLDKIVIGKPLDEGAAANGFIDASLLSKCVSQAQAKGWNAGVMFWEWTTSAPSIMGTVRGTN